RISSGRAVIPVTGRQLWKPCCNGSRRTSHTTSDSSRRRDERWCEQRHFLAPRGEVCSRRAGLQGERMMVNPIWPESNGGHEPLPAPNVVVVRAETPPDQLSLEAVKGILVNPIYTGVGPFPGWSSMRPGSGPAPS